MPSPPLSGIRVLDCSRLLPGPACSQLLASLGASVLRVDHPDPARGDLVRTLHPQLPAASEPEPGDDRSYAFIGLNHGKSSVRLDLTTEDGRRQFLRLAAGADVVLESFRSGVLDRHGCGWAAISTSNPAAILCSITGYGQTGPDAARAGHDITYLARGGALSLTGEADRPPLPLGTPVADVAAGTLPAAVAILAALRERDGTAAQPGSGLGQHIDVSIADGARGLLALDATAALAGHAPPPRGHVPLSGAAIACYRTYACADGYVAIGAVEPKFWGAWCDGVGRPELRAAQGAAPGSREAEEIELIFAERTREQWAAFGRAHDCCLEPVLTPSEAFAAAGADATSTATGPDGQPVAVPAHGVRFSRSPHAPSGRAPASGADDAVLDASDPWAALEQRRGSSSTTF